MSVTSIRLLPPRAEGETLYLVADDLRLLLTDYSQDYKVRMPFRDDGWIRLNFSLQLSWWLASEGDASATADRATCLLLCNPADVVVLVL